LLRGNGTVLQLEIEGASIVGGPVTLTFMAHGIGTLARAASHLADLRRILSADLTPTPAANWTARSRNLRDGFVVHDCIAAGGNEREAGGFLYGASTVSRDWRRAGLRHRIRRDWMRAKQLISGGYRKLLE